MQFTPQTDSEIKQKEKERKERWVWPTNSTYDFDVIGVLEKEGEHGTYLWIDLNVFHPNGQWTQKITDFIGATSPKLKDFCYAVGMGEQYEAGNVNDYEFSGKAGKCQLSVKKDKNGQYPDKNKVSAYSRPVSTQNPATLDKKKTEDDFGDSVPF